MNMFSKIVDTLLVFQEQLFHIMLRLANIDKTNIFKDFGKFFLINLCIPHSTDVFVNLCYLCIVYRGLGQKILYHVMSIVLSCSIFFFLGNKQFMLLESVRCICSQIWC